MEISRKAMAAIIAFLLAAGGLSSSTQISNADTELAVEKSLTLDSKLDKLVAKFRNLERKYAQELQKARRSAGNSAEKYKELVAEIRKNYPDPKELIEEIHDLAKKKPKSKSSRNALIFLATQPIDKSSKSFAEKSLFKYHGKSDNLLDYASALAMKNGIESEALLKKILKTKSSKKVKSVAAYGIASNMIAKFKGSKADEKDIIKKLNAVIKYGGKTKIGGRSLKTLADNKLFGFTKLRIGAEAEDIVGEDLDGEKFKLSDYRGKVVFLDFWGDW